MRWPGPAEEGQPRARRQQRVHRARRRRSRRGGAAGAFSSFQFQGQVCFADRPPHRPRERRDRLRRPAREKAERLRTGDPYREDVDLGPIVNEKQLRARRRHRPALRRRRGARSSRAAPTRASSTDRPFWPTSHRPAGLDRRDLRPGRAGHDVRHRRRGGRARQRQRVRAGRRGLFAVDLARPRDRPAHSARAWSTSTTRRINDEATIPFGGMGMSGNGGRFGGEANLDNFTQWQWVTVRDEPPTVPVLMTLADGVDHRGRATRRRVDRHCVARRLASRLSGQRRRPARACSTPPGRSTTCPMRSRVACSRARSRSWA